MIRAKIFSLKKFWINSQSLNIKSEKEVAGQGNNNNIDNNFNDDLLRNKILILNPDYKNENDPKYIAVNIDYFYDNYYKSKKNESNNHA